MFPPRTTGWTGSAARIAAVSEAVVVLPFVPVTPIVGATHRRRKRSGSDTRAGASASPAGAGRDERRQGRAQPRLGRRVVRVDRGRRGDERGVGPGARGVHVRPERQRHVAALERRDRVGQVGCRSAVVDRHPGAGVGQEARQRDPAPCQPQHRHRGPAEQPVPDGGHREGIRLDRPVRHRHPARHASRSGWSVARNSVTPSRAARIPTIQKRIVIFSSSQPPSSKWWWMGLIRKRRFPPLTRK